MVGKLCKAITVGLGAALACSITAPAWSSDCKDKSDDPLVVLPNFNSCVFHDQSESGNDPLQPLDYLDDLSPGEWRSFARYNFIDKAYSYRNSGPNKNDKTDYTSLIVNTDKRRSGTFDLPTILNLLPEYSEFAVSLIKNRKVPVIEDGDPVIKDGKVLREFDKDLTNNDYVLYTFDVEDWKEGVPTDWNSAQFGLKNNGDYKKITDLKIFVKRTPQAPVPKPVPEPMFVLGLVMSGGIATVLKRKLKGNN
jgi:hypothetical protein